MPFKSLAALSAARGKAVIKESKSERVHFSTAAGIAPVCVVSAIEPVVMPMPRSVTASTPVFGAAYAAGASEPAPTVVQRVLAAAAHEESAHPRVASCSRRSAVPPHLAALQHGRGTP